MKFSLRHQSTGKVYPYLAPLGGHSMLYGFFRKIHVRNRRGVPSDKPVLLAANHPTAFVDPILLCTLLDPPIYNMTRGDVFKKPFFRKLMESINMFPVFRVRDGYASRDRNDEVFEYCIDKLFHRRVVTIYVEGEHHLEKRVRSVHKGIARIAFAAYERHQLDDLHIIPAGCNYVAGDRPRDEAMVNIGAPIPVRMYWEAYQRDPAGAIQHLCRDIETALREVCFHVESPYDIALAEQLLTLHRSNHPVPALPVYVFDDYRFEGEKAVIERLNALSVQEKAELRIHADAYFGELGKAGVTDEALMNPAWGSPARLLFFIAGFIPWLIGFLGSWPLIRLAKYVADTKATKREFYTSVRMGLGMLAGIPYYFMWLLAGLLSGKPLWIALGLSLPLLGWFAEFYRDMWRHWLAARKAAGHPGRSQLLHLRSRIPDMQMSAQDVNVR
jgi:1-acyl-sn-glycerol-3-phosphate acyltransferase